MQDRLVWINKKHTTRITLSEDGVYCLESKDRGRWYHITHISVPGVQKITGRAIAA